MSKLLLYLSFLSLLSTTSFSQNSGNQHIDTVVRLQNNKGSLDVYLKFPKQKPIGTIVVLPGWNLPVIDWCTKTALCQKALEQGYVLIMPEMGKSVYSYQLYPETRKDWLKYATRQWFIDTLIPYFQKQYKLLLQGQKNYLLGLSTGARGVALLSLDCPTIFVKAAGLSGDYDQTKMPNDNLMKGYYGPYAIFKERWTGKDNVVYRCKELYIPIYLGHGKADQVVSCQQTIQLADSLKKYRPQLVTLHLDESAGHTYQYWDSEVDRVLAFFK